MVEIMKTAKTISLSSLNEDDIKRILSRCFIDNECLTWPGSVTKKKQGYGRISLRGKLYCCHRVIWTLHKGEIPQGLLICHTCDNSLCCNIDHMFIGNQSANMLDMVKKGRCIRNPHKGHNHPKALLTKQQVEYIRKNHIHRDFKFGGSALARMFNVGDSCIHRVIHGQRYIYD